MGGGGEEAREILKVGCCSPSTALCLTLLSLSMQNRHSNVCVQ